MYAFSLIKFISLVHAEESEERKAAIFSLIRLLECLIYPSLSCLCMLSDSFIVSGLTYETADAFFIPCGAVVTVKQKKQIFQKV